MSGEVPYRPKDPADRLAKPQPKPTGYVAPQKTVADEMLGGLKSAKEVAGQIIDEAYGPLRQFCSLPAGFSGRELKYEQRGINHSSLEQIDELNASPPAMIIDPRPAQVEAIELLRLYLDGDQFVCRNRDPFQPIFGANFVGPPGCGKTHILSAFAHCMKQYLDSKLEDYRALVTGFVAKEYGAYLRALGSRSNPYDDTPTWKMENISAEESANLDDLKLKKGSKKKSLAERPSLMAMANKMQIKVTEQKDPTTLFQEKLDQFKRGLSRLQYQPPDLLYLDFESLWELCRGASVTRDKILEAIIRAKVVFLDDVHPKGDIERLQIVLHVIEGRYTAGRMGTFITTNLTTEDLAGTDKHILHRLQSRCQEMFYEVNFTDCIDWRTKVKHRRVALAKEYLQEKFPNLKKAQQ